MEGRIENHGNKKGCKEEGRKEEETLVLLGPYPGAAQAPPSFLRCAAGPPVVSTSCYRRRIAGPGPQPAHLHPLRLLRWLTQPRPLYPSGPGSTSAQYAR